MPLSSLRFGCEGRLCFLTAVISNMRFLIPHYNGIFKLEAGEFQMYEKRSFHEREYFLPQFEYDNNTFLNFFLQKLELH